MWGRIATEQTIHKQLMSLHRWVHQIFSKAYCNKKNYFHLAYLCQHRLTVTILFKTIYEIYPISSMSVKRNV